MLYFALYDEFSVFNISVKFPVSIVITPKDL